MRTSLSIMALAAMLSGQALTAAPAFAEGADGGGYSQQQAQPAVQPVADGQAPAERQPGANNDGQVYQGKGGYYRHECGGNGAVGTIAGGVGGGVLGHLLIGGGPIGILIGGVGGALLGRHFDKRHTAAENHC